MTQGFLLFAYDNEEVDYGLMALWTARRIQKYLNKSVSLVTDQSTKNKLDKLIPNWISSFDKIFFEESSATQTKKYIDKQLTFHNLNRINSWNITPYDETIVIDTDVIIQSTQLNKLWGYCSDIVVCDQSTDLYGVKDAEFTWVNDKSIKFFWATAFYFKKTDNTKLFFDHCKYIKENYSWFKHVYDLYDGPVRNDFIWSVAIHSLGGTANNKWIDTIPWNIHHSNYEDRLLELNESSAKFLTKKGLCKIKELDVHVMNKFDLVDRIKLGVA
jgi:hypothetical protein